MKAKTFIECSLRICESIADLIKTLPDKGNKCEDSQKICLTLALKNMESVINGTTDDDWS